MVCESWLTPRAVTAVLVFSRRVVEPRAPAALGSDADLCHQGSGLGKDALQLAEQRLNRHSLGWKVYKKMLIYSAKIVTRELLSRAERV